MTMKQSEYKWRKTVRPEGETLGVKGENCPPDERFASLDWRDYIEISDKYVPIERKFIETMLDDLIQNVPEVRYLLRQTHNPVNYLDLENSSPDYDPKKLAEQKVILVPSVSAQEVDAASFNRHDIDGYIEAIIDVKANGGGPFFGAYPGAKTIIFDPLMVDGVAVANEKDGLYQPSCAEIFIHELIHLVDPAFPFNNLTATYLAKQQIDMAKNSMNNSLYAGIKGDFEGWLSAIKTYREMKDKGTVEQRYSTDFAERMTVPQTNVIGKRYFGTEYRSVNYFERSDKEADFSTNSPFTTTRTSNLVPMMMVDMVGNAWRDKFCAFYELKERDPKTYEKTRKSFVKAVEKAYKQTMHPYHSY
jgi:hypothetical protein